MGVCYGPLRLPAKDLLMRLLVSSSVLLVLLVLPACGAEEGRDEIPMVSPALVPAGHGPTTGAAPVARQASAGAAALPGAAGLSGEVVEHMDTAGYTYLKLATDHGEVWAAVPQTKVAVGAVVTVSNPMPMKGFESPTLKRTFELIYFGTVGGGARAAAVVAGGMPADHPPIGGAAAGQRTMPANHPAPAPTTTEVTGVDKAAGGHTIAEVYAARAKLAGQPVRIRGEIVKYNGDIMGKNWLHLRDGSGDAGARDNDITVTTAATAAVGEVVTVEGVLELNKDFGFGYEYGLIIEGATVTR